MYNMEKFVKAFRLPKALKPRRRTIVQQRSCRKPLAFVRAITAAGIFYDAVREWTGPGKSFNMIVMDISFFDLDFSGGAGRYAALPLVFGHAPPDAVHGVITSAAAGSMHHTKGKPGPAREAMLHSLGAVYGFDPARTFALTQIHSRDIRAVDRAAPNTGEAADGMITIDRAVTLTVTVADCLPVFLYDTQSGARALLHSGWRGTGIVLRALEMMAAAWGTRPEAAAALLGPCIQPCCYAVDEERARNFEAEFGGDSPLGPVTVRRDGSRPAISLQAANARLLAAAGVRHCSVCRNCTFTDTRLGSFRREGAESYTKMMAIFPAPAN
ncbi:MAG: polyphenol oxidase family protein [Spirochaetaceae bacterium]|jgi:YfiH family protein|nr:polyphenol oxidase family protein [Spirochaetaceae bacterium]